ncbi:MAG: hypothetical protein DME42_06020 [Verrucomicrobia bacterium]|nr:MAG: hypothetical protein DME42_06020 [Verrucomicrobiota bacterium]
MRIAAGTAAATDLFWRESLGLITPSKEVDFSVVIQSIREFNRTVPFVPYEIHTASGERYEVPQPDFISISPKGSFVVIIDAKERPHHLNALLIERASLLNGQKRRKSR